MDISITVARFGTSDAERITGVSAMCQRDFRRHGYLPPITGHARFDVFELSVVLATQMLSNVEQNVLEAVLGNMGTLISFRVGATDAPVLVKQFGANIPSPRDLVNLPNYEMFIKLMIDGRQSKPFSARTIKDVACLMRA